MIDTPIAVTELDARLPTGAQTRIVVQIGAPVQFEDHAACQVFVGPIDNRVRKIYGEDTMQALTLALRFAMTQIESAEIDSHWTIELAGQPFPNWRVMFGSEPESPDLNQR